MSTFLFALIIAPLQECMSFVLYHAYALAGSYGAAIILLSLCVNAALIPVYHLAEGWQEDERVLRRRMAGKLDEIKAVYSGRERDFFTRAVYRMHGYHPLMSLRTSVGLLIQIPFFFAAYSLLHANADLQGISFFFIHDLGSPDALLNLGGHAVNLLPFVMTGVNLLSAAVYSARLSRRDKIQLYGLAALFLVLLYTASAGLLLYWTCNNIFSLFKNMAYTRFVYTDTRKAMPAWLTHAKSNALALPGLIGRHLSNLPVWVDLPFVALGVACMVLGEVVWKRQFALGAMLPSFALIFFGAMLCQARLRNSKDTLLISLQSFNIMFAAMLIGVLLLIFPSNKFKTIQHCVYTCSYAVSLGMLLLWLLSRKPVDALVKRVASAAASAFNGKKPAALFGASAMLIIALSFIYEPAELYASDPTFFFDPLSLILGSLLFKVLLVGAGAWLLFRKISLEARPLLAVCAAWCAVCAVLYVFVAVVDYGPLNSVILQDTDPLRSRKGQLMDAGVLLGSFALMFFMVLKHRLHILNGLFQGLVLVVCVMSGWSFLAAPPNPEAFRSKPHDLPDYNDRLLGFSKSDKNIVVFMLDSFTGTHAGEILAEDPDLAKQYDGFTWFSDVISPGSATRITMPSIMGGERYDPYMVNQRADQRLLDTLQQAYAVLPNAMLEQNYDVSLADITALEPKLMRNFCPRIDDVLIVDTSDYDYTNPWRKAHGLDLEVSTDQTSFMMVFGLFQSTPISLRRHIYSNAKWLGTTNVARHKSQGSYAMLDLMSSVSNVKSRNGTFKVISNMLPHPVWQIDSDCMPVTTVSETRRPGDGAVMEYYWAERCALRAIGKWLEWLKRSGIYDNTKIIIVSDHGNTGSGKVFSKDFDDIRSDFSFPLQPTALLMFKDFGERHVLATSKRLMASADVPSLICRDGITCPEVDYPDPLAGPEDTARTRYHTRSWNTMTRQNKNGYIGVSYIITGPQFDRSSWERAARWEKETANEK